MPSKIPGEFVPLDVNYTHDRRIREAGALAELLFIRGMAYCRRTKSHGEIPAYDLPVVGVGIPNPTKLAKKLESTGLWLRVDGGWTVRSWAKWNPSSTEEVRVKQSQGGVQGNHNRWHVDGVTSDDCPLCPSPGDPTTDHSTDRSTDQTPITHPTSVGDRSGITEVEREEEREKKDSPSPRPASPAARSTEFDAFWEHYPRKVGKDEARKRFNAAVRKVGAETIILGAKRLAADPNLPEKNFIPHPSTWLNRGGWDDEPYPPPTGPSNGRQGTDDRVQAGIDLAQRLASQTLEIEG